MTRWLVYKHKFNYIHMCDPPKECAHKDCTLEFIVSINEKLADAEVIQTCAISSLENIAIATEEENDQLTTYNFGTLSSNAMLDDLKKLFLTMLPDGEKKVHLWFDKDSEFSLWDDGQDVNSLCK